MTTPARETPGEVPGNDDGHTYEQRWGQLPAWLGELTPPAGARVVQVAVRVGMRLAAVDWHLREDAPRPDVPAVKRPRGPRDNGQDSA